MAAALPEPFGLPRGMMPPLIERGAGPGRGKKITRTGLPQRNRSSKNRFSRTATLAPCSDAAAGAAAICLALAFERPALSPAA